MTYTDKRRPRPGAAPSMVIAATEASVPRVRGLVLGPHAGRRRNLIVAPWCPRCEGSHRHTSDLLAPVYTRWCPVTGRRYEIASVIERDTRRWSRG